MKKILLGLFCLLTAGAVSSCKETDKIPAPAVTSVPLIFPKISSDVNKSYFNFTRSRLSINALAASANPTRPVIEFTLELPDQRDVQIKSVEVYKSFSDFRGGGRIGPRAYVGAYSSFPAVVSLNSQEALTGLQKLRQLTTARFPSRAELLGATPTDVNDLITGDRVIFTFEYVLEDGSRVILTPLTDVKLEGNVPPAKVISGNLINPPYALYVSFRTQ